MSRLYCDTCNNLLIINTFDDVLKFECMSCRTTYPSMPDDTLRYEETKDQNIMIHSKLLEKAVDDPVNPKVYKSCPKCKNTVAKIIRLGNDMKIIYTCVKCKHQWV